MKKHFDSQFSGFILKYTPKIKINTLSPDGIKRNVSKCLAQHDVFIKANK